MILITADWYKRSKRLVGKGFPLGTVQEIKIWSRHQMMLAQCRIRPSEWDASNSLRFGDTNDILPSTRRPDRLLTKKKKRTYHIMGFNVLAEHKVKIKESEIIDKQFDLVREGKTVEHEVDSDMNCSGCSWNDQQRLEKENGKIRSQRKNRNHPDLSIVKIGWNSEKSLGDLRRLTVTQTPWKSISQRWR